MDQVVAVASSSEVVWHHQGWTIEVLAEQDRFGWRGSALVQRDGQRVCQLTASHAFETRHKLAAALVARSDRWIAARG